MTRPGCGCGWEWQNLPSQQGRRKRSRAFQDTSREALPQRPAKTVSSVSETDPAHRREG